MLNGNYGKYVRGTLSRVRGSASAVCVVTYGDGGAFGLVIGGGVSSCSGMCLSAGSVLIRLSVTGGAPEICLLGGNGCISRSFCKGRSPDRRTGAAVAFGAGRVSLNGVDHARGTEVGFAV